MAKLSAKLTGRLDGIRAYPVGLSADDVLKLKVTPDLVEDILDCLASSDAVDQQIALFFAEILIRPNKIEQNQQTKLITRIVELSRGMAKQVQAPSYKLLARYRAEISNYRTLMLEGLKDSEPMVRKEALLAYESYCQPKEVALLETFESDTYVAESSMGGPLIYELRNLALEMIERAIGKIFNKAEKAEALTSGEVAYWWDWTPYHAWKNNWFKKLSS